MTSLEDGRGHGKRFLFRLHIGLFDLSMPHRRNRLESFAKEFVARQEEVEISKVSRLKDFYVVADVAREWSHDSKRRVNFVLRARFRLSFMRSNCAPWVYQHVSL